jgi:hypothetical protein
MRHSPIPNCWRTYAELILAKTRRQCPVLGSKTKRKRTIEPLEEPERPIRVRGVRYSGAGVPLWTNRYNGPANKDDDAKAVAVDASGNVFVTGYSDIGGGNYDYATVAYSNSGVPLWTNLYGPGSAGSDARIAVDGSGNVFVAGSV